MDELRLLWEDLKQCQLTDRVRRAIFASFVNTLPLDWLAEWADGIAEIMSEET